MLGAFQRTRDRAEDTTRATAEAPADLDTVLQRHAPGRAGTRSLRQLHALLLEMDDGRPWEARLDWLARRARWSKPPRRPGEHRGEAEARRTLRLRLFLRVLHEHPVWRERFARLLRSVLTETAGYRLFTETGLPIGSGVFSDAGRRLVERFLPRRHDHDLSELLSFLFWTRRDVRWLESLPTAVVVDVVDLLHDDDRSDDDLPARWAWSRGWCAIR